MLFFLIIFIGQMQISPIPGLTVSILDNRNVYINIDGFDCHEINSYCLYELVFLGPLFQQLACYPFLQQKYSFAKKQNQIYHSGINQRIILLQYWKGNLKLFNLIILLCLNLMYSIELNFFNSIEILFIVFFLFSWDYAEF